MPGSELTRRSFPGFLLILAITLAGCAEGETDGAGGVAVDSPPIGSGHQDSDARTEERPNDGSTSEEDVQEKSSTTAVSTTRLTTTTVLLTTTTTTLPSVNIDGRGYECTEDFIGEWTCEAGFDLVYCSGLTEPDRCSPFWYPDELDHLRLVEFGGLGYACEQFETACVRYDGGPPPSYIVQADIWCDASGCLEYDSEQYLEVMFQARTYLCELALFGFQKYDCYGWYGGTSVVVGFEPDLYCSGSEYFPDCSMMWYPSELASHTIFDGLGGSYLCESAYTGRYGDYDCGSYTGGDPSSVYSKPLKCSSLYGGIECDRDDYPSLLADVFFTTIDWGEYACLSTWGGSECWRYSFGSVETSMFGLPDYYCNHSGYCDPWGYP